MELKKLSKILNLSDREKCFHHDLLNHTHGLLLFLSHKKKFGKIDLVEIESLAREIEVIQKIIQLHFNEELTSESISIDQFVVEIEFMIDAYLKSSKMVVFQKIIDNQYQLHEFITPGKFHVIRFLANHFKNMNESTKSKIEIKLFFDGQFLKLETKNDILDSDCRPMGGHGIGLKSMKNMSEIFGGDFQFSQDGIFWYCNLIIPFQRTDQSFSQAA